MRPFEGDAVLTVLFIDYKTFRTIYVYTHLYCTYSIIYNSEHKYKIIARVAF
jgi:hypothetical protein